MIDVNRHVSIQMDADGNVLRIGSQKTSDEKPIEASTNAPAITVDEAADLVDVVPNQRMVRIACAAETAIGRWYRGSSRFKRP